MFDGNLGDWATGPVNIELNPGSKKFNGIYYPVPIINKETFFKDLTFLVETGVLPPLQQSQYSTPAFIIPKKERNVIFIIDYRRIKQQLARKTYP